MQRKQSLPFHRLIQAFSLDCGRFEDLVFSVFQRWQAERVCNFCHGHRSLDVLLVSEHHKDSLLQLIFLQRKTVSVCDQSDREHDQSRSQFERVEQH